MWFVICSLLAILRIGAVYVPLDVGLPVTRLTLMIRDCEASAVLLHDKTTELVSKFELSTTEMVNVSELAHSDEIRTTNRSHGSGPAAIFYTSGSTGTPKGIQLQHYNLRNALEWPAYPFGRETVLQQSGLGFDMSLHQILLALCHGGRLFMAPRTLRGDALALSSLIASEGITATLATPTEYSSFLSTPVFDLEIGRCGRRELLRDIGESISSSAKA